jgi:hypothetical protein
LSSKPETMLKPVRQMRRKILQKKTHKQFPTTSSWWVGRI